MSQKKTRKTQKGAQAAQRPLWLWILLFLFPLVMSEVMFYAAGRQLSMILFPIVWIGFWLAIAYRNGWIFGRNRSDRSR